jgi:hypothetical protein
VNALGRVGADLKLAGPDPFHEFADAVFDLNAVTGFLELGQDFAGHALPDLGVGFQNKLLLLFGGLNQFVGRAIGLDANENTDLLGFRKRRVKPVKAADKEIADEAIEEARVVAQQDAEAVAKMLALLVGNECQVRGHRIQISTRCGMAARIPK